MHPWVDTSSQQSQLSPRAPLSGAEPVAKPGHQSAWASCSTQSSSLGRASALEIASNGAHVGPSGQKQGIGVTRRRPVGCREDHSD